MTETFVSEDETNCPCVEFEVEKVKDKVSEIVLNQND